MRNVNGIPLATADSICFLVITPFLPGAKKLSSGFCRAFLFGLEEAAQVVSARGVPQFAQRLGFDLADAFASHAIDISDLLQRVSVPIDQAETHFEDLLLALTEL